MQKYWPYLLLGLSLAGTPEPDRAQVTKTLRYELQKRENLKRQAFLLNVLDSCKSPARLKFIAALQNNALEIISDETNCGLSYPCVEQWEGVLLDQHKTAHGMIKQRTLKDASSYANRDPAGERQKFVQEFKIITGRDTIVILDKHIQYFDNKKPVDETKILISSPADQLTQ